MSRIANNPVELPSGVEFSLTENIVTIKGSKGQVQHSLHPLVSVFQDGKQLKMTMNDESKSANALAGTTRALMQNFVTGVSVGHERKLTITGVGYRAQLQGKILDLSLGFSHPVKFEIPEGISIETPTPTEIVIRGHDKQLVGQVAANIRAYRPPEPYKGKGVRYADEDVVRKEAKKT